MSTYNKQTWTNGVSPTSAERMTHIENGIKSAQDDANLANTRISSIATLPEGSTTGDAELIDARTTYNGFTFSSLGACTRKMQEDAKDNYDTLDGKIDTKVSELNDDLTPLKTNVPLLKAEIEDARVSWDGFVFDSLGEEIRQMQTDSKNTSNILTQEIVRSQGADYDQARRIQLLENGGFQISEDFLAQEIEDWLDEHPEATTTVQDHSLSVDKMLIGTLGYVTPEMFGAVGDGVNDDTEAIKNAITYSNKIIINRTYLVSEPITISGKSIIEGNGKIIASFFDQSVININSDNVKIKGIEITNGQYTTGLGDIGAIESHDRKNILIDNVKIHDFSGNGLYLCGVNSSKVCSCKIERVYANGIFIGGAGSNNNVIETNYIDTTVMQNCIFITASPDSTQTDNFIYNNTILNNIALNAGDTNIESGIHAVNTRIISNYASNSVNPSILVRDNKNTHIENNFVNNTNNSVAITCLSQIEDDSYINNGIIGNNRVEGSKIALFITQSGFTITNNYLKGNDASIGINGNNIQNLVITNNELDGVFAPNWDGRVTLIKKIVYENSVNNIHSTANITFDNCSLKMCAEENTMTQYQLLGFSKNMDDKSGIINVKIMDSENIYYGCFKFKNGVTEKIYGDSKLGDTSLSGDIDYAVIIANTYVIVQVRKQSAYNVNCECTINM